MLELFHIKNIIKQKFSTPDKELFSFLKTWNDSDEEIQVETSGSTGNPKGIVINKKAMKNSALATNDFFNLSEKSVFLHCLPTKYIAGKMMLIRCIQANGQVIFSSSFSNPIENLDQHVDFCAMTPFQVANSMKHSKDNFKWIKKLIIGGASIDYSLEKELKNLKTECFHTFGMTETVSHIAIRKINSSFTLNKYSCLDHVTVAKNENDQLIINAPEINVNSLVTNDIINLVNNKTFIWKGRKDNIINSGGIKQHPELIETKLRTEISDFPFIIDKEPNKLLGEQVILIINHKEKIKFPTINFNCLSRFEIPKKVYLIEDFIYTKNNKINRRETKEKALSSNRWYKPCQ